MLNKGKVGAITMGVTIEGGKEHDKAIATQ
jgi:hypothetical protein